MRKTIKKVMIDVIVFITSCQVSEKPKRGPVSSQATSMPMAHSNAVVLPVHLVAVPDKCSQTAPNPPRRFVISPPGRNAGYHEPCQARLAKRKRLPADPCCLSGLV